MLHYWRIYSKILEKYAFEYYKLDPAHYLTAPSLSWDAMLKMTGIVLENMTDYDMYLLIESGIRGGMCSVGSSRYSEANNKYMPNYNKSIPSSFISYLDANNLYGYAMNQVLPLGDYKWEEPSNFDENFIKKL